MTLLTSRLTSKTRGRRSVKSRPSVSALAPWALTLIALGLGLLSLASAHQSAIGPYGLIQALPPGYFVSLVILVAAFILTWMSHETRYPQFITEALVLVILLHGAPGIIESEPRFHEAWTHAGFTDYVALTGRVLPHIDARFSWPSFFTGVALLMRAGGVPSAISLLRWWPVFINLMYLPPLFLLAKLILRDAKKAMLVVWIFPFAEWVGQDYYSPQSVAFLLYLVFACVVLGPFAANRRTLLPRRRQQPSTRPEDHGHTHWEIITLLVVMLVLCSAMITGHQLTPAFAVATVTGLAIVGRTRLVAWPAVLILLTAGWVCYGAIAFWSGHFHEIFGAVGNLGGNVSANLGKRLRGSAAHYQVLDVRLLMFVVIWATALAGLYLGRKAGADRRSALVLMLAPVLALAGQPYGGEAGLRVFLFSLPGALCLTALALTALTGRMRAITAAGMIALLIPGFLVARWGNEQSEIVLPGEISAMRAVYATAPPGSVFLSVNPQVPWEFQDIGKYKYVTNKLLVAKFSVSSVVGRLTHKNPPAGYVVVTVSQAIYAEQSYGLPHNWAQDIQRSLISSHLFRLVYQNPTTSIYRYKQAPRSAKHTVAPHRKRAKHTVAPHRFCAKHPAARFCTKHTAAPHRRRAKHPVAPRRMRAVPLVYQSPATSVYMYTGRL